LRVVASAGRSADCRDTISALLAAVVAPRRRSVGACGSAQQWW
jgi:hypothetical protein